MKINLKPPKKEPECFEWYKFFAIFPVRTETGIVWLEYVERRVMTDQIGSVWAEYRDLTINNK